MTPHQWKMHLQYMRITLGLWLQRDAAIVEVEPFIDQINQALAAQGTESEFGGAG